MASYHASSSLVLLVSVLALLLRVSSCRFASLPVKPSTSSSSPTTLHRCRLRRLHGQGSKPLPVSFVAVRGGSSDNNADNDTDSADDLDVGSGTESEGEEGTGSPNDEEEEVRRGRDTKLGCVRCEERKGGAFSFKKAGRGEEEDNSSTQSTLSQH